MFENKLNRNRWTTVRMGAFYLFVLLFVGMGIAFVGFLIQWGVEAWFSPRFGDHRLHVIVDGAIIAAIVLGVALQLYKPTRRVGALQTSLLVLFTFASFSIAGGGSVTESMTFVVVGVAIALVHPSRGELIPSVSTKTMSPRLASLAGLALLPLGAYAIQQFGLQLTLVDDHAALGHWANMATFAVSVILLAFLASLKPQWWLFPALTVGILAIAHGLASMVFETSSAVGPVWGGLELLWGVIFIGVAVLEYTGDLEPDSTGFPGRAKPIE